MKNEDFFQLLGEIDGKYIEKASEDLSFWQESQKWISVRSDYSRKSFWKTSIASVACTAVAVLGIFVLLLNVGKIGITENPASSVSEPDNSTSSQNDVIPDVLFEEAAYAYEGENFDELQRYEVGDKFGENAAITSAKTTYKISDGAPVIQKQDITVYGSFVFELENSHYETDGSTFINIYIGRMNELGLPFFATDFDIEPIYCDLSGENIKVDSSTTVNFSELIITVNYDTKTITLYPQHVSIYND